MCTNSLNNEVCSSYRHAGGKLYVAQLCGKAWTSEKLPRECKQHQACSLLVLRAACLSMPDMLHDFRCADGGTDVWASWRAHLYLLEGLYTGSSSAQDQACMHGRHQCLHTNAIVTRLLLLPSASSGYPPCQTCIVKLFHFQVSCAAGPSYNEMI